MPTSDHSARKPAHPARIQNIFLHRLQELEERVTRELERPAEASGPVQELLRDIGREAWTILRAASSAVRSPGEVASAVARGLSGPSTDELGVAASVGPAVRDWMRPLSRIWLGLSATEGADLPAKGGVLVMMNRSAWPLPLEPFVIWSLMTDRQGRDRRVCVLWEPTYMDLPFVGEFLHRLGVFAASETNCEILLERGCVVVAFPEGRSACDKTYDRRYRLARFEAARLLRAAVTTGSHVVPAAVVGNEESYPMLGSFFGLPVTPFFPLAGLAGALPLPLAWRVRFGRAVEYAHLDDVDSVADALVEPLRARMQALIVELLEERKSIFSG